MTISVWRYSHLALAIASFIFVLMASVTGVILAFEPIATKIKPYAIPNADTLTLAETLHTLNTTYSEVLYINIDGNDFVSVSVVTKEGNSEHYYIDPFTGEKIGDIIEKAPLFKFATNLHRSLFLKRTGRFFVGLASFLLFLIAVSGMILLLKRQGSLKKFFGKIVKENIAQYYHVVLGRMSLIPILIITLTGVYLSLLRFSVLPDDPISHKVDFDTLTETPKIPIQDFDIFKTTRLSDVRAVEFPFSEDVEDYYHIKLKQKELLVHQYTGEILSEIPYPFVAIASRLSIALHTGEGSILWSVILAIASINILFFIYSGFTMTFKRRTAKIKNKFNKENCEYVILTGSEHGSTIRYAMMLHQQLLKAGKRSYLTELNNFSTYPNLNHLIVITATYGQGDPPANARKFKDLYLENPIRRPHSYSVVGFGSLAYPDFCRFALDVDALLATNKKAMRILDAYTINNKSFEAYTKWITQWAGKLQLQLSLPNEKKDTERKKTIPFTIIEKTKADDHPDNTFLMTLRPEKTQRCHSGDLLAVYRKGDDQRRLYSIGLNAKKQLLLSIKKHPKGVFSNYLNDLRKNDTIEACVLKNPDFHFPKKAPCVILVSNGTGIAPFLGMLAHNTTKIETHLYWGGRHEDAFALYKDSIDKSLNNNTLKTLHLAYSKAHKEKIYVQHLLQRDAEFIANALRKKAVLMVCGSVAMQDDVLNTLENLCMQFNNKPLQYYKEKQQLKTDCY